MLLEHSVLEPQHAIDELADPIVVAHDQHALAALLGDLAQPAHHLAADARVEVRRGLVGEHEIGVVRERTRDRDALVLAAGQLLGEEVEPVAEPELPQQALGPLPRLLAPHTHDVEAHLDVLARRQRGHQVEVLEDEADPLGAQRGQLVLGELRDLDAAEPDGPRRSGARGRPASRAAWSCRCRTVP